MSAIATGQPRLISADSHVIEPANCYVDYIESKFKDRAPKLVRTDDGGDSFVLDDWKDMIPITIVGQAGVPAEELKKKGKPFSEVPRGGWDSKVRLEQQTQDGVSAEVLYPSVGLILCNHPDASYKRACMWAYNRWLQDFTSVAPDRLIAIGQIEVASVAQAVDDLKTLKSMGFRGVMLPGTPSTDADYHDESFDPLWRASIELQMPISFHILTSKADRMTAAISSVHDRGKYSALMGIIRSNQDLITLFIMTGVFDRHPELKFVCVESEAGWAAHQAYRLDRHYDRFRQMAGLKRLSRTPGEFFRENVYLTFQDDIVAFQTAHLMNAERLLWASDFPHTDSTWPHSRDVLERHARGLPDEVRAKITGGNTARLYGIA